MDPLPEVLDQVTPEGDIHDLVAAAHRQQRHACIEREPGHSEVEGILLLVDVVQRVVRLLTRPVRRQVTAPGQQDRVGEPESFGDLRHVDPAVGRGRMDHHRFAAGGVHPLDQRARSDVGAVPQGRRGDRESGRNDDQRARGHGAMRGEMTPPGLAGLRGPVCSLMSMGRRPLDRTAFVDPIISFGSERIASRALPQEPSANTAIHASCACPSRSIAPGACPRARHRPSR